MPPRKPAVFLWQDALELLDQAERMQRRFFVPGEARGRRPSWQPPVDILETEDELFIIVALPGVNRDQLKVVIEDGKLVVAGDRPMPGAGRPMTIHRLELPHGRFERAIDLPAGRFEIGRSDLADGCLVLSLRKLG